MQDGSYLQGSFSPEALQAIFHALHVHSGCDFSLYKQTTTRRRLQRRKDSFPTLDVQSYLDFLENDPSEKQALFQTLLIGVTTFFRDPKAFERLRTELESLLKVKKDSGHPLRVWVPACSTGEEVYSLSILIREAMQSVGFNDEVLVFASDIDAKAIETARRGWYSSNAVRTVSESRLATWFDRENGGWRAKKLLRENVIFAPQNLLSDPPYPHIDLLSCRNFLIYLNPAVQKTLGALFAYSLAPGGLLFLGTSESVDSRSPWFVPVDKKAKLYRRKPGLRPQNVVLHPPPPSRERRETMILPEKTSRDQIIQDLVVELIADKHLPPCALVDAAGDIQFIWGDTSEVFQRRKGKPSHQIVENAVDSLRIPIANALALVASQRQTVVTEDIRTDRDSGKVFRITIYPVEAHFLSGVHYLLVFQGSTLPIESVKRRSKAKDERDIRIRELERELEETRLYLKNTVQKLERANEMLTASNEETQSINEELQSANEELESSKEELQATNEELGNLNLAYSNRIDDLSRLNNDIFNFVHSARIGIVFLDRSLRILRFTPETANIFPVIESDLGRSITAFSSSLAEPSIDKLIQNVLRDLSPVEREFRTQDGRVYLHRILPYRTLEDRIEGVVMTFTEVSELKKAEERLRASEEKYRALFENLPVPVLAGEVIRDENGGASDFWILGINPAFEKLLNVSTEVALGNRGAQVLPYMDKSWVEVQERVVMSHQPEANRIFSPNLKKHLHTWVYPSGKDRFALILEDVTEQTEALEALRLSEDLYRSTLTSIDDFVSVLDKDGRFLEFFQTRKADELFAATELFSEKQFGDLPTPPEVSQAQERALAALASGEKVKSWTYSLATLQGEKRFSARMSRRLAADGSFNGAVLVTRDISDLIHAQQAVLESEFQFRALFEAAPLGFFQIENGRLIRVNFAFANIFGFSSPQSLENHPWDDLFAAESLDQARDLANNLARGERNIKWADLVGRRQDGSNFPLRLDLAEAPREGKITAIGVAQDMTERRRIELTLLNSQRLESLGVLAGGIAHDFNNLLGAVFGFLELAQQSTDPASRTAHYIERSISAFHRAQDLTRQLITFSKGGHPVKRIAELRKLLEENARFVLSGGNVRLETAFSDELWPCEIDTAQMSQVVDNLIINARQAMPNGGTVTLTAKNVDPQSHRPANLSPGAYVRVSFADNGPGIAREILPKIFDPFFSTKKEGSGLGLATVYSILAKHGGVVEVESEQGKGTVFHLWIPALPTTPEEKEVTGSSSRPVSAQRRILVLDDEESLREVAEAFLQDMGYEVVCVARGEDAFKVFLEAQRSKNPFGFALVDLTIPGEKGGLEVVKDLRQHNPTLRAAAMSGYSNDHVLADPVSYGLVGCLAKPFTRQELRDFLEAHYPPKG